MKVLYEFFLLKKFDYANSKAPNLTEFFGIEKRSKAV
jgi:hypothetical protein